MSSILINCTYCFVKVTESQVPVHKYTNPLVTKKCKQADKVRALCYNHVRQEIAVISLNSFIHCWNAMNMKQVRRTFTLLVQISIDLLLRCIFLGADETIRVFALMHVMFLKYVAF